MNVLEQDYLRVYHRCEKTKKKVPASESQDFKYNTLAALSCRGRFFLAVGDGFGKFLLETLYASGSIDEFLLSGKERMAIIADFDAKHGAFGCRTGLELVIAAGAMHRNGMIIGVYSWFHGISF